MSGVSLSAIWRKGPPSGSAFEVFVHEECAGAARSFDGIFCTFSVY